MGASSLSRPSTADGPALAPGPGGSEGRGARGGGRSGYDVAIVGAGITGLSCGHALASHGVRVVVIEAASEAGGCIGTETSPEGFVVERGPHTVRDADGGLVGHLEEVGLGGEIVDARGSDLRYILRNGRLAPLPRGPVGLLTSSFMSPWAKLRMMGEPFVQTSPASDPSVRDWLAGRLGSGVADGPVDAFVSGVWAGDASRLSARACFPALYDGVEGAGGMLRYAVARRRAAKERNRQGGPGSAGKEHASGDRRRRARLFSLRGGLMVWPRRLADSIGPEHLRTHTRVDELVYEDGLWTLQCTGPQGRQPVRAQQVVMSGGPSQTAELVGDHLSADAAEALRGVRSASMATVHLGFDGLAPGTIPDGFGVLAPAREARKALGILFTSSMFPGRAPAGSSLTTTFMGGMRNPDAVAREDDDLIRDAVQEHQELFGIPSDPVFARVYRVHDAIPQYEIGHGGRMARLREGEQSLSGLHLAGRFRGGVSVVDCWRRGEKVAETVCYGLASPAI